MFIKNTTDVNNNKIRPKIIGIHKDLSLAPGEEQYVPDELIYVDEVNRWGKKTGKRYILPALLAQERMGLISMRKGSPEEVEEETEHSDEDSAPAAPAVPTGENKEDADAEAAKKAEAAAKRAATRAANKAAKEAAGE